MEKKVHVINCDAVPSADGKFWKVVKHKQCGQLEWDSTRMYLEFPKKTYPTDPSLMTSISGFALYKRFEGEPVLNACVLDYLLAHPELIPEEWQREDQNIFFWGTIYRFGSDRLYVHCLSWDDGYWVREARCLEYGFIDRTYRGVPSCPAILVRRS